MFVKGSNSIRLLLVTFAAILATSHATGTVDYSSTTASSDSYNNVASSEDKHGLGVNATSDDNRVGHADESGSNVIAGSGGVIDSFQTGVFTTEPKPVEGIVSLGVSDMEGSGETALSGRSGLRNSNAAADHYDRCAATGTNVPSPCHDGYNCAMKNGVVVCSRRIYCHDASCSRHGVCSETSYGYSCVCDHGYRGRDCDYYIAVDPTLPPIVSHGVCNPNPCKGDCTCRESCKHEGGYFCSSRGGFVGKNCDIPVPKVNCGSNSISMDIPGALYEEFDKGLGNSYFYVAQHYASKGSRGVCEALSVVGGSYRITISLPFAACGTKREKSGAYTFIRNKVFIDRRADLFSVAVPVIEFECKYEKQYQLVTSLKPVINLPGVRRKTSPLQPIVELCKVSSWCPLACPTQYKVTAGAVYTVGEMIHISVITYPTVHMNDFLGYVTTVNRMALSCSRQPPTVTDLHLINDGCVVDTGFYVTSKAGHIACVELQTPRGVNCESVYIHMHLVMCKPNELMACKNGALKRCPLLTRRKRRSASVLATGVTTGPFVFIDGSIGEERTELYPGAALTGESLVFTNGKLSEFEASFKDLNVNDQADDGDTVTKAQHSGVDDGGSILALAVPGAALLLFVILLLFAWYGMSAGLRSTLSGRRCRGLSHKSSTAICDGIPDTSIPLVSNTCGVESCHLGDGRSCRRALL